MDSGVSNAAEGLQSDRTIQRGRNILFGAWLVSSTLGAAFLIAYWSNRHHPEVGHLRAVVFIVAMSAVCFVGYRLYRRQSAPQLCDIVVSPKEWKSAFQTAIILQAFIIFLAALVLDGGLILHGCVVAALAYWAMAAVIVLRRHNAPTQSDLRAISCGYLVILFVVQLIGQPIWALLGR